MNARPVGLVSVGGGLAALLGVGLFVYFVRRAGVGEILEGIQRLGWVFLVIVALGGLRLAMRGMAWRSCLSGTHRLSPFQAFLAVVAGDTLGNLTPFSLLVGEPAKALVASHREPVARTLPALAVENLFYTLSAALVIAGGGAALVLRLQTADRWWLVAITSVVLLIVLVLTVHVLVWRRVRIVSRLLESLVRGARGATVISRWSERVCRLEERLHQLYPRDGARLFRLMGWEFSFHALGVLEIYIMLSLISALPSTFFDAFLFESTNRFITSVFKVVPMRIGVDEAGTGAFAELLAFGTAAGVTLAIVRRARMLVWMTLGVVVFVGRGLSVQRATQVAQRARRDVEVGREGVASVYGPALVVMARSPEGSRTPKSRLATVLSSPADRRRLYAAFLEDVITTSASLEGVSLRVAYTKDGGTAGFEEAGVSAAQLLPQRGESLGDRERGIFEDLFAQGYSPVVVIGSDLPTLTARPLTEAFNRLQADSSRVVLGPTPDGGYYLIGLSAPASGMPVPDLFSAIRWSTEWTRADTIAAAEGCGLEVERIEPCSDVDDAADLARLRSELATVAGVGHAPRTTRVLRELFPADTLPKTDAESL